MKTKSLSLIATRGFPAFKLRMLWCALLAVAGSFATPGLQAANQTWTNAPADNTWTNVNNWNSLAVPGALNLTGNTVNNDVVTFTNPIPVSGIGGVTKPILIDDATIAGDRSRQIGGITFDTTNCGAYVISSLSPPVSDQVAGVPETGILNVSQTNSILMTAAVTNSQTFILPIFTRLPSSTAGVFTFINNAASSNAILYITAATNDSANTRGTVFTLDGTNTGTNTIAALSAGVTTSGVNGFTKQGTGTWILSGPDDFRASTVVNIIGGLLIVKDPGAFNTSGVPAITNATLRIDGVTLSSASLSLRNAGVIQMNGSGMVNGIAMSANAANSATLATTSPTDVMTVGNTANTFTGGAIDSVLHITGSGTVLFDFSDNYLGKVSVDSGTNQLSSPGGIGTGPNLNVSAGAVFDTTPIGATTYTLDTKAFSANGTGTAVGSTAATVMCDPAGTIDFASRPLTLTFTPVGLTGDSGHPALYCSRGTMSFHGNAVTINNASGSPLNAGTYQLVNQASGNIVSSGAFVALVTGSGLAPGMIAEIDPVGGNLNLVVSAYTPKSLAWVGNDPINPGVWDRQTSTNWLAGSTPVTFNIYDSVLFNAAGSAQPNVNLAATMQPGSVTVDTSANTYTFTGSGQIAGGTSLVKINTGGTLILQTANTYSGGTIISNGVVQLDINEGVSSTGPAGANDVTIYSPAVFDLNGFINTVNGLNGSGTIDDVAGGGTSTLNIGLNGDSGVFSGVIRNTSGALGIFKTGTGIETLTASNTFVGPTTIDTGTLRVTNMYALGAGYSPVTINSGTLDMQTSLLLTNLNGAGGFVMNSSAFTNTLTITSNSTFSGIISGKIGILVNGGTLRLNGVNTYSNGTIVAANAGLAIGGGAANAGTAGVIASNNTTMSMPNTASASSAPANAFTTVDGATVTFISSTTANNWAGQFNGSALATNIFANGNMSIGGALSFSNFLGTVIITNGEVRWFNAAAGGDNTIFDFIGTGGCFARDNVDIVHLGALFGDGVITAPSVSYPATYVIGGLGIDSEFSGAISGSNNITKIGLGRLTLDGAAVTINTDNVTYTNYLYASDLTYINTTTVSNGVLAVSVPNDLTTSPNIVLAATNAVLDTLNMGYVTNFNDINNNADSALVTNGTMTIVATSINGGLPQVLGGIGVVKGNGVFNYGTINPGFTNSGGTLTISNSLTIEAGAFTVFDLSDDPTGLVNPGDVLNVEGSVTLSGASTLALNALNGTLNPGKYRLIKYSGNLINEGGVVPPGPISNFTLGGNVPATSRATLVLSNAPGEVDLVLVSLNNTNLFWQGDGASNFWDVATSFNWTNKSGVPFQFFQQDTVTFNSSSTNALVTLQGTVSPNSILITGATNYIFAGPGNISGDGGLTLSGTGSLLLTNGANSYAGGTVINSGVLRDGSEDGANENDLALGTGPVTVNASAELRFGGNPGGVVNHFITNNIIVNGGLVKAYDGVQHLTNSTVTINAGGATFETIFSTKNIVLDSPLNGAGSLTVASGTNVAAGQIVLDYGTNNFNGPLAIATNGNVALVGLAGLSNCPTIDVQQGGILDVSGRSNLAWSVTSGQTLKGNGTLRGKFITASAGSIVAPGITGAIGTLTVTNQGNTTNFAVATLAGTLSMDINRASAPNADRILNVNGTNAMGGTLTVNNLGAALVLGDSFQLLVANTNTGAFGTLNLPALSGGLTWSNSLAANGKLTVVASVIVPTIPPGITNFSLAGGNVVISGTNGQAGGTYYLLSTTNVITPRPQWHCIATNVLGANNYTFIGTNAVKANTGQQFYMLSSTNSNP